ncbi:MAG: M23 family metallopeptidase [Anaerolineae bacterium]|nr:M23 family metallopeptidase [Anaerolineae bacterium]
MTIRSVRFMALLLSILLMVGCEEEFFTPLPTPSSAPTLTQTPLFGVPVDTPVVKPILETATTPTLPPPTEIVATSPPALVLPDSSGVAVACADNAARIQLLDPRGGVFGSASRIVAHGDWLYLLIDGGLYRVDRLSLEAGQAASLEPIMVTDDFVAGRPVQELVDLDADTFTQRIYTLDKVGHVFRFDEASSSSTLVYQAKNDPNEKLSDPSYEFVALTVDDQGQPVILDSSRGALWIPANPGLLLPINQGKSLTSSVDVTYAGGRFYTLQRNNSLRVLEGTTISNPWRDTDGRRLGLALKTSDHLGTPLVYSVDGVRREVIGMLPGGSIVTRYVFAFPDIGLLRDAVFANGRLFAVADDQLLIYPGPASPSSSGACPTISLDTYMRPELYGVNILDMLAGITNPIDGARLPSYSRLYPGASRLYRFGIHQGVDFFGYQRGWPVVIMADGVVVKATLDYAGVSTADFKRMTSEAELMGKTPPEYLALLEGKQVLIDHGNGILSFYAHLDQIAAGIVPGATVKAGQLLGTVGVSGTLAESQPGSVGSHLHFEIRIGERYLGHGITIRESMWWLDEIFANMTTAPATTPTP